MPKNKWEKPKTRILDVKYQKKKAIKGKVRRVLGVMRFILRK
jgi:hypothetical protein